MIFPNMEIIMNGMGGNGRDMRGIFHKPAIT
jgi:hypothetical protein